MSAISQRINGFTNLDPKLPKRIITKGEKIVFTLLIGGNDHNTVLEAGGRTKDLREKVKRCVMCQHVKIFSQSFHQDRTFLFRKWGT